MLSAALLVTSVSETGRECCCVSQVCIGREGKPGCFSHCSEQPASLGRLSCAWAEDRRKQNKVAKAVENMQWGCGSVKVSSNPALHPWKTFQVLFLLICDEPCAGSQALRKSICCTRSRDGEVIVARGYGWGQASETVALWLGGAYSGRKPWLFLPVWTTAWAGWLCEFRLQAVLALWELLGLHACTAPIEKGEGDSATTIPSRWLRPHDSRCGHSPTMTELGCFTLPAFLAPGSN